MRRASAKNMSINLQVNTNPVVLVNRGVLHTEGGWPKEIDCTEIEQVIRYRKRVRSSFVLPKFSLTSTCFVFQGS